MYNKGGRGILSVNVSKGARGIIFVSVLYSKGGRGILSVTVQQGGERDSLCKCTARVGEGISLL